MKEGIFVFYIANISLFGAAGVAGCDNWRGPL